LGGHIHKRTGRGKRSNCVQDKLHEEDITKGIKIIANWLIKFSHTDEETKKDDVLKSIVKAILPFIPTSTKTTSSILNNFKSDETPSLFIIQMLFLNTPISNSKECNDMDRITFRIFSRISRFYYGVFSGIVNRNFFRFYSC